MTIGLTDYAQSQLKDIVYVDIPQVGFKCKKGDSIGVVESVKTVADIDSPITGKVMDGNFTLKDHPQFVNDDPYGKGWIIKMEIKDKGELKELLSSKDYQDFLPKEEENLAAWADASDHTPLQAGVVQVKNGAGAWELEVKYPDWGRYLVTAEDKGSGHRAGKTLYIDWPGWAGRGQKDGGAGASVLAFAPDKQEYAPGETVTLAIPTPQKGRGLVSLESGPRVLKTEWTEAQGQETRDTFTASPEMSPNVYAHVTLLQRHAQTANDLPIRLYGIAPIRVVNPQTRLKPVLEVPEVLAPDTTSEVAVREAYMIGGWR